MTYLDAHGRPELVMHPDVKRGTATVRVDRGGGREPHEPRSIAQPIVTTNQQDEEARGELNEVVAGTARRQSGW